MFYTLFVCGHYFFNTGLYKSTFSTYYFGKLDKLCRKVDQIKPKHYKKCLKYIRKNTHKKEK